MQLRALLAFVAGLTAPVVMASDMMPAVQQNALVQKYCAVCHSDAVMAGGFSLQHFDAAHADPTMAAMLLSKLTSGLSLQEVEAARSDAAAAALVVSKMKSGAMGAAGRGVPDRETQDALVGALSVQAAGAKEWTIAQASSFTASIVRELPSTTHAGVTDIYRLALTCRADTREAEVLLAWANGVPDEGRPISVAVDGKEPFSVKAEGGEKQGNGKYGPGSVILPLQAAMPLPGQTLTISNVFPNETVVFPFSDLSQTARAALSMCFGESSVGQ